MTSRISKKSDSPFLGGVRSARDVERLNLPPVPRIVFAGRSNVGKSSLLNSLAGLHVARVSQEPGKTQEINFYTWRDLLLVDLPGYGFAKVPKDLRAEWGAEVPKYLKNDDLIFCTVVLVDGRHGFTKLDQQLVSFLLKSDLPFVVAFTKMDKHKSANLRRDAIRTLSRDAASNGVELFLFTSATEKTHGVSDLKKFIFKNRQAQMDPEKTSAEKADF